MLSPGKRIYSQHFPQPAFDEEQYRKAEEKLDAIKGTPLWTSFEEHLRELEENIVYVLRPDKVDGRQRFIDLAKQLSLDCEIDMDIWEYDDQISVNLYLYCCNYTGAAKDMFSELLTLCDCVSILRNLAGPFDFTLSLDYNTHDCYLSGKQGELGQRAPKQHKMNS